MKVNLNKLGAIVAGATLLASSAAFAGLMYQSTTLVDANGAPVAKVVVGSNAAASDGVAAAMIAGKIVSEAYKETTLTAEVSGDATCTGDGADGGAGTCAISNELARLEITVPGSTATGTWTGSNLIGDYLNRELMDRVERVSSTSSTTYTDSAYALGGSDTTDSANPFTDGNSSNLGESEVHMYKVDGGDFSPFADKTLTDSKSGNSYVEKQALWLKGDNHYDTSSDSVVGKIDFLAYTLKFDGPGSDEIGVVACTEATNSDYSYCLTSSGDLDDATETNKLKVWFLGDEWIFSDINPSETSLASENYLVTGGSVKLAKESVSGILNQGESLPVDDLKFQLDDLEAHGDTTSAIISVLDANGNVLEHDTVQPTETQEYTFNGKQYRFHVYKVAPGYTFGAKWADVAIFADELELSHGQKVDADENTNPDYKVILGWKNLDASADDSGTSGAEDDPDALRTIVIYSDEVEDLSSGGDDDLEEGEYIPIVQDPVGWKLHYKGLSLTSADRESLKFEIVTSDKTISASKGPLYNTGSTNSKCTIYAPYVKVTSGSSAAVFEVSRSDSSGSSMSNNVFYVAVSDVTSGTAAMCDADGDGVETGAADYVFENGTVFMQISTSSDYYGVANYSSTGVLMEYDEVGDGDHAFAPPNGGAIHIIRSNDVTGGSAPNDNRTGDLLYSTSRNTCSSTACSDLYFAIAEKAGDGTSNEFVDYWVFGIDTTHVSASATFDFDSYNTTSLYMTSASDQILYGHATPNSAGTYEFYTTGGTTTGPVNSGMEMVEENYVSERGSVFKSIEKSKVEFDMAHELATSQWFLASSAASSSSSSTTVATLAEGQSTTVSGVTVKVVEITETVGACSAAGGAVACTADMSEVSAVIRPNNAASVDVAVPYAYSNYGNLVILDTDAVGVNTLISVGGDKVNSITANLLEGAGVDWSVETQVVREVEQGQKIVVAGKESSDTLAAAQKFVNDLRKV